MDITDNITSISFDNGNDKANEGNILHNEGEMSFIYFKYFT